MLLRDAKHHCGCVWNYYFVVKIVHEQEIWYLKFKSLTLLVY